MIKTILGSLREYRKESILSPLAVILEVVCESLIPFSIARLVNSLQIGTGIDQVIRSGVIVLVLAILSLIFGALAGNWAAIAATGLAKNLRKDMFESIQDYSFENINKFSSASLVTRLTTDISNVQMAYMMIVRGGFRFPIMLIFSMVMAYLMAGKMAFIFLFTGPAMAFVVVLIMRKVMPIFKGIFKRYDQLNKSIQENIKAIRVVKSFVREDYETEKFTREAEDLRAEFTKAEKIIAINEPAFVLMLNVVMFFVISIGSYTVIQSRGLEFNVGQMSALLTYSFQILNSIMLLSMIFVMITMAQEPARRISEVLKERSLLTNPQDPVTELKDGSISFENVCFSYDKKETEPDLCDVTFAIKAGETVGIIGATGSAKSTLIQLIPRLYDVNRGSVKVGGVDVRDYDLKTLREDVALVLQKNVLFSGTIKDNLRWGKADATDEEMEEVCKIAQAHDFIIGFEDGYDSYIEQGGSNLSGGQRQRLSIARALIKSPKILILDDSTSAVDTKTDAFIRRGIKNYMPETTKLIIAQRIASVQDADKIMVMDQGRVIGFGSHDELLDKNEIYREIYQSQTKVGEEIA